MHFIGSFNITDNIIIGDPYIGRVMAEYAPLTESNRKRYEINSRSGTWYAYHAHGNYTRPIALVLIEEEYNFEIDINSITPSKLQEIGLIVSAFGHMLTAVDKQIMNNTMYTYVNTSDKMIYRIKDVRKWLNEANIPTAEQVKQLLNTLENKGLQYVESMELLPICKIQRIPIESDLWANDCYFRLKDNPLGASVIMGGIVTKAYSPENVVYIDDEKDCRIIYIDLDENACKAPVLRILD